jgi:hypothetical protein
MSDIEEFQAVDIHDLEEEEALSDDEVIPEPVDNPNQGEVGPLLLVSGMSSVSGTITTFSLRFFFIFKIRSPWRFMVVISSFMNGCFWPDFGSRFQKLLGS